MGDDESSAVKDTVSVPRSNVSDVFNVELIASVSVAVASSLPVSERVRGGTFVGVGGSVRVGPGVTVAVSDEVCVPVKSPVSVSEGVRRAVAVRLRGMVRVGVGAAVADAVGTGVIVGVPLRVGRSDAVAVRGADLVSVASGDGESD